MTRRRRGALLRPCRRARQRRSPVIAASASRRRSATDGAVVVRHEEDLPRPARRLRRQQLAAGHHGLRQGRGHEVPERHVVQLRRRPGQHAEGHLRHQGPGRQGRQRDGGLPRRGQGGAARADAAPTRPASSRCPTGSTPAARPAPTTTSGSATTSPTTARTGPTGSRRTCPERRQRPVPVRPGGQQPGHRREPRPCTRCSTRLGKYKFIGDAAVRGHRTGTRRRPRRCCRRRSPRTRRSTSSSPTSARRWSARCPCSPKSGRSIPALATSDGNVAGCFWQTAARPRTRFKMFTVATGNDNARLAVD